MEMKKTKCKLHRRAFTVIGLFCFLALGLGGACGGGKDTAPPLISQARVEPSLLGFPGGEVSISAQVTDDSGVAAVWARVTRPDGTYTDIDLSNTTGSRYEGKFTAPANVRHDEQAEEYAVALFARDALGNETPEPGVSRLVVRVSAPKGPPAEPEL